MKTLVERQNWDREEYFQFFSHYGNPFFTVTADIDVSGTYMRAKKEHRSFFIYSLHKLLTVINTIENFHYRIDRNGDVVKYDIIHVSPTVGRPDGSYAATFMEYSPDFDTFEKTARSEIERALKGKGLMLKLENDYDDAVFFSALPWFSFTEIVHPFYSAKGAGNPLIATGRLKKQENGRIIMPLSISAHHGFADGYHAGQFFIRAEQLMK